MTAQTWNNRIFTNIYNAVSEVCTNVINKPSATISDFPTVKVHQIGGIDENTDLENNDCGAIVTYEVSIYTHGSKEILENQEIQSLVYDIFKKMGFQLIQLLDSDSDGNEYYRVISRYRRYIGAGNEIELITNDD